ncbi:MAG: glycosyltransferase family 4 protein [Bacteroidia bacterium]|nr:glycosyltransferase family 4 protein [Bacteroidia bacterium]MDW8302999.1 glycosyltransferase family 4 protein [Bacteroidia bacterium]
MSKKVLFITYYFPPSGGSGVQRPLKFIKYLPKFDWEPVVLTAKDGEYPAIDETLCKEVPSHLTILRTPAFEPYKWYKKFTNREKTTKIDRTILDTASKSWKERLAIWIRGNLFIPDARKFWIYPSVRFLSQYLKKNPVQAIISTGPPHSAHLIALKIKKKFNLPWIADFRDPWTTIYYHQQLQLSQWAKKRHIALERKVLKQADIVITVGKTLASELAQIRELPVEYIYNGYDEEDFLPYRNLPLYDKFTLTYVGTTFQNVDNFVFWNVLRDWLKANPEAQAQFQIRMIGKTPQKVKEQIISAELSDYVYYSPDVVEHHVAIEEMCKSHLLFMSIVQDKNMVSGKLFEYIASRRPVLCFCHPEGDAARIIQECDAGIAIKPEDTFTAAAYLSQQFEKYKVKDYSFNTNSNIQRYSRQYQAGQLAKLLDKCIL